MLELTWQKHPDHAAARPVLIVHTNALARLTTTPAVDNARCLLSPAVLRHAEPILCAAAQATGVGILGQWILQAAIMLAQQALEDR